MILKFFLFITFALLSVFIHWKEISDPDTIYRDNYYHYLVYSQNESDLFEKDLINKSLTATNLKNILFNPIVSLIYSYFLKFASTPKYISIAIAVISQILASVLFFYFIRQSLNIKKIEIVFIYSLFFSIFISVTNIFFSDFRRNIGFLLFLATIFQFYSQKDKAFLLFSAFFGYFYSASLPFILTLVYFRFIRLGKKIKLYYFIPLILILLAILNHDILKTQIDKIKNGFEWKDHFKTQVQNINFIENYFLNFNEYPKLYVYYFYSIISITLISFIIIAKEKAELFKKIFAKEDFILFFSVLISFSISCLFVSPGYASKQTNFAIPFLTSLILIKSNETIANELRINIGKYFILILILIFFPFKPDSQFQKINSETMSFINENTSTDSLILSHPSDIFIPYFTKRNSYAMESSEKIICTASRIYCAELKKRYDYSTDVYYTDSLEKIKEIIGKEKIDYVIVDKKYYSKSYLETPQAYDKIRKLSYEKYLLNKEKKFKILELAEKYGTKIDDSTYFIDVKKIL